MLYIAFVDVGHATTTRQGLKPHHGSGVLVTYETKRCCSDRLKSEGIVTQRFFRGFVKKIVGRG